MSAILVEFLVPDEQPVGEAFAFVEYMVRGVPGGEVPLTVWPDGDCLRIRLVVPDPEHWQQFVARVIEVGHVLPQVIYQRTLPERIDITCGFAKVK